MNPAVTPDITFKLLNLADYIVNKARQTKGLPPAQTIKDWEGETRDPEAILDKIIPDSAKAVSKTKFLESARERASKLFKLTPSIDDSGKHFMIESLWGKVKGTLKSLKLFFVDLKDQSERNIDAFSEQLVSFIKKLRSTFESHKTNFHEDKQALSRAKNFDRILGMDNFKTLPVNVTPNKARESKVKRLAEAMNSINLISALYFENRLDEPCSLVEDLVDMSRIQAKLHTSIDDLAKSEVALTS